jgi:hypothetical protein
MGKQNVKTVEITVPNEKILQRIKSTPALRSLSRLELKVGVNTENVNHFQFNNMMRMFPIAGCQIKEIVV